MTVTKKRFDLFHHLQLDQTESDKYNNKGFGIQRALEMKRYSIPHNSVTNVLLLLPYFVV